MIREPDDPHLVLARVMPAAIGLEVAEHYARQALNQLSALGVQYFDTPQGDTTGGGSPSSPDEELQGEAVQRLAALYMTFLSVRGLMASHPSAWSVERAD